MRSRFKLIKKCTSLFMMVFFMSAFINVENIKVIKAAESKNNSVVKSETILQKGNVAKGVEYTKKQINLKDKSSDLRETANIIKANLNDKYVKIVTAKAKESIKSAERLSLQIQRETKKGKKVVAGINGDMYYTSTFMNVGPQVKDGRLLLSYGYKSDEKTMPIFGIDSNGKAFIDKLNFNGNVKNSGNNKSINIDTVNREPRNSQVLVYTKDYTVNGRINISKLDKSTVYMVVSGNEVPLKLDKPFEGKVEQINNGNRDYIIKGNKIVVAASGAKAKFIKDNFKVGSRACIQVGFSKKGISELMGGYNYLVYNGRALSEQEMINKGAESFIVRAKHKGRTAIGITAKNEVVAITVDGGYSNSQSYGLTLPEMAKIMEHEKVVKAINLDGGGSTQMNVRGIGKGNCSVVNRPSDGRERGITNSILFLTNAPRTDELLTVNAGGDIIAYKGSKYKISLKAIDANYNVYDFKNPQIKWECNPELGTISEDGVFTAANKSGQGQITVTVNGVKDVVNVKVLDEVSMLSIVSNTNKLVMSKGESKKLSTCAKTKDGKSIVLNNNCTNWKVSGNIGTIDKSGLFKAVDRKAKGKIIAQVGNKSCSIDVEVGKDPVLIDNFEHGDNKIYYVNGYIGGMGTISTENQRSGRYSYKITYNYDSKWKRRYNGTINVMHRSKDQKGTNISSKYISEAKPKKIGMWVCGDGKAPWLRAVLKNKNGGRYTINFVNRVNWKGWKYVEADVPSQITTSVQLDHFYFVETNKNLHYSGKVYVDDIRFIY
ncbi:phosphodiester glycosidase family protein [Haloimpatiens sp. FM7330]|uniref:phosphodiester glycosidase family protein n=1 Tax=Haloimpatiens sp. FM7330 TaxID=3298610 RepID=UPI0036259B1B